MKLTLDRKHMIAMLEDPAFYATCPDFTLLRSLAGTIIPAYHASAETSECRCGPDFAVAKPLIDEFFKYVLHLNENDPAVLTRMHSYWGDKKGSNVDRITLYYRVGREKRAARLTF